MSHLTTISDLTVNNLAALRRAGEQCGLVLREGQQTFRAYERGTLCAHALAVEGNPDAYEVGVVQRAPGWESYDLRWDNFGGSGRALESRIGKDGALLKQHYGAASLVLAAQSMGFAATEVWEGQNLAVTLNG